MDRLADVPLLAVQGHGVNNRGVEGQVMYFDGCPSWRAAFERLRSALEATGNKGTRIQLVRVQSETDVAGTRFAGSPTLLVDRQDLFPGSAPVAELACRPYATSEGLRGSPTQQAMVKALSRLSTPAEEQG